MKLPTCYRCKRRLRNLHGHEAQHWNVEFRDGYAMGYLCPDCQTPEEDAEAERNLAIYDYSRSVRLPDGRFAASTQPRHGRSERDRL